MTDAESAAALPAEARPPEPPAPPVRKPGHGVAWAAAALALAAVATVAWLGWQQRAFERAQDELRSAQAAQRAVGENLRGEIGRQGERLGALDAGQRDQARDLAAAEQGAVETRAALEKLYAELKGGRDLLPADEAAFLVRNAQYALHLARDPATALRALELAEARLREHGDPKWLPAREALGGALAKLRAQPPADLTGITARLRALAARAEQLPVAAPSRNAAPGDAAGETPTAGWREFLRALWADLKSLVRVRHAENKFPLLAPEQRYFLGQNLALLLNSAQWAALRGDATTYRANLEAARDWLRSYFDAARPPVVEAQAELSALLDAPLAVEPPDLAPLLALLGKATRR